MLHGNRYPELVIQWTRNFSFDCGVRATDKDRRYRAHVGREPSFYASFDSPQERFPPKARLYGTGHGFTFQISVAYSVIVRSVENFPELATFKMVFRAQASGLLYKSSNRWSASRYDFKSAKCM
jgi:hypothetical protein